MKMFETFTEDGRIYAMIGTDSDGRPVCSADESEVSSAKASAASAEKLEKEESDAKKKKAAENKAAAEALAKSAQ